MRLPELVLPAGRCRQADRPARAAARWHPAPAIRPSTTTSCSPGRAAGGRWPFIRSFHW